MIMFFKVVVFALMLFVVLFLTMSMTMARYAIFIVELFNSKTEVAFFGHVR